MTPKVFYPPFLLYARVLDQRLRSLVSQERDTEGQPALVQIFDLGNFFPVSLSNLYERTKFSIHEEMLMNDQDFTNVLNVAPARVAGIVRQYVRVGEDVEDVVQTTLLKVWEHRATYNPAKSDIWTWVHQIATNTAIDFLRAEGTRRGLIPEGTDDSWDHLVDNYPDETPGPEEEAYTMQVMALARAALDALPPDQREVFVLRTSKGLSHKQIAVTLGISVANSEQLFHRARAKICQGMGLDTYN